MVSLVAQTPSPTITSISVPSEVGLGNAFEIEVRVRNDGGTSSDGGITVSFPDLTGATDKQFVANNGSDFSLTYAERDKGELIWNKSGTQVAASYLMAEVYENNWVDGETHTMKLRVTPQEIGSFTVQIRSAFGQNNTYYGTPTSGSTDQQGWNVTKRIVTVLGPPEPEVKSIDLLSEIELGEWVDIEVRVENDGDKSDEGGVTVSFPDLTGSSDKGYAEESSNSSSDLDYHENDRGDNIYHRNGNLVSASYLMVEGVDVNWTSGEDNYFRIRVQPQETGNFRVWVRSAMKKFGQDEYVGSPDSGTRDQQGWEVISRTISVTEPQATVTVSVKDLQGDIPDESATRVKVNAWRGAQFLGTKDANAQGQVFYETTEIEVGESYRFVAYYEGPNAFDLLGEFWDQETMIISSGENSVELKRSMPYTSAVRFSIDGSPVEQPDQIPVGATVDWEVDVINPSAEPHSVTVQFRADRNKSSPYEEDETTGSQSVAANGGITLFSGSFVVGGEGRYHYAPKVDVSNGFGKTDSWDWVETFTVATDSKNFTILLVHGLNSNSETFEVMKGSFIESGYQFGGNLDFRSSDPAIPKLPDIPSEGDLYTIDFSNNKNLNLNEQSLQLNQAIELIRQSDSSPLLKRRIILIGHSMGGLASRAYLQNIPGAGDRVAAMITIGTPHWGSPLANAIIDEVFTIPVDITDNPFVGLIGWDGVLYSDLAEILLDLNADQKAVQLLQTDSAELASLNDLKNNPFPSQTYAFAIASGGFTIIGDAAYRDTFYCNLSSFTPLWGEQNSYPECLWDNLVNLGTFADAAADHFLIRPLNGGVPSDAIVPYASQAFLNPSTGAAIFDGITLAEPVLHIRQQADPGVISIVQNVINGIEVQGSAFVAPTRKIDAWLSTGGIDFGDQEVGGATIFEEITVSNPSANTETLSGMLSAPEWLFVQGDQSYSLEPGGTKSFSIGFNPQTVGEYEGAVKISGTHTDGFAFVKASVLNNPMPAEKPSNLTPADGALDQLVEVDLSWVSGAHTTDFHVYFGTDPTLDASESYGEQTETSFDPDSLAYATTYYWRIDAKNSTGQWTVGDVWSFTTESEPVPNSITLIAPNGGEIWQRGSSQIISWNSSGSPGSSVKLEYSPDGGSSWQIITTSSENDGSHDWLIPSAIDAGSRYRVRVTSTDDDRYRDSSDGNFSITEQPELIFNDVEHVFDSDGGSHSFDVSSNLEWTWMTNGTWIVSDEGNPQSGSQNFAYSVLPNPNEDERIGSITLRSEGLTQIHTVTQAGKLIIVQPPIQDIQVSINLDVDDVFISWISEKDKRYSVESSTDMLGNWKSELVGIMGNGQSIEVSVPKNEERKFYRVRMSEEVSSEGLIAYFPFDEGGENVAASTPYGNAFPTGQISFVEGVAGQAVRAVGDGNLFYSGGGYVGLPQIDFGEEENFSVSLWVNLSGHLHDHAEALFTFGIAGNQVGVYATRLSGESDKVEAFSFLSSGQSHTLANPEIAGQWHHYAITFSQGHYRGYFDGMEVVNVENIIVDSTAGFAALGRHWWADGANSSARLSAAYDELRIYERALTPTEITHLSMAPSR